MTHFAHVVNGVVSKVIVAEQDFIDNLSNSNEWVQTSYNTHGGINERTGIQIRKNFAGIGYTYDSVRDAFYSQKPYDSWTLNDETCIWNSPVPMPTDGKPYEWNEELQAWDIVLI
jgi:hypothetical protein